MGALLDLTPDKLGGVRSATETHGEFARGNGSVSLGADWGVAETGATVLPAIVTATRRACLPRRRR